ncbi:MAG TPA: hypothetical protein VGQ52_18295 [Gemmatimonadaceae bacterium]|jgi:hypothetical protein|nr:hypothetical protein [Gemmatimonadaceae bacterium]
MKRKGARDIPDFSRKPKKLPGTPGAPAADTKAQPAPHPASVVVKPQGPPMKGGRRGQ